MPKKKDRYLALYSKCRIFAADYQTITLSCYQNNLINHKSYSTMKKVFTLRIIVP